jgi:hypothetical protein
LPFEESFEFPLEDENSFSVFLSVAALAGAAVAAFLSSESLSDESPELYGKVVAEGAFLFATAVTAVAGTGVFSLILLLRNRLRAHDDDDDDDGPDDGSVFAAGATLARAVMLLIFFFMAVLALPLISVFEFVAVSLSSSAAFFPSIGNAMLLAGTDTAFKLMG